MSDRHNVCNHGDSGSIEAPVAAELTFAMATENASFCPESPFNIFGKHWSALIQMWDNNQDTKMTTQKKAHRQYLLKSGYRAQLNQPWCLHCLETPLCEISK